jgi:hypothetical protein
MVTWKQVLAALSGPSWMSTISGTLVNDFGAA